VEKSLLGHKQLKMGIVMIVFTMTRERLRKDNTQKNEIINNGKGKKIFFYV